MTIQRVNAVATCAHSAPLCMPSNSEVCAKGRSTHGCRCLNLSWLAARRLVKLGTTSTSTKYTTRPPAELRSNIPSMTPIESETRLPRTMVVACPTERSHTVGCPAMVLPTTLPTEPTAKAKSMEAIATMTADQ